MRIESTTQSFLDGSRLSNGHVFRVERARRVRRNSLVVSRARGKVVLHVGCADHLELIEEKRRQGTYLHDLLADSTAHVVGSDLNDVALEAMRGAGFSNLHHPDDVPSDTSFDLVVATDVIEHVADVHSFLSDLRTYGARILVTTPNAMRLGNRTRLRTEFINTDHRYWFSPYTLCKSLVAAGYQIEGVWYTDEFPRRQPVRTLLKTLFPLCRDGLAVLAKPAS